MRTTIVMHPDGYLQEVAVEEPEEEKAKPVMRTPRPAAKPADPLTVDEREAKIDAFDNMEEQAPGKPATKTPPTKK